jgi:hypothetical protein
LKGANLRAVETDENDIGDPIVNVIAEARFVELVEWLHAQGVAINLRFLLAAIRYSAATMRLVASRMDGREAILQRPVEARLFWLRVSDGLNAYARYRVVHGWGAIEWAMSTGLRAPPWLTGIAMRFGRCDVLEALRERGWLTLSHNARVRCVERMQMEALLWMETAGVPWGDGEARRVASAALARRCPSVVRWMHRRGLVRVRNTGGVLAAGSAIVSGWRGRRWLSPERLDAAFDAVGDACACCPVGAGAAAKTVADNHCRCVEDCTLLLCDALSEAMECP